MKLTKGSPVTTTAKSLVPASNLERRIKLAATGFFFVLGAVLMLA